jgi:hypothetical protein
MEIVKIKKDEKELTVHSTFNPELPTAARKLGGKWNGEAWIFSISEEELVRKLYKEIYGTDGSSTEMVDLRATFLGENYGQSRVREGYYLGGIQVARAFGRDSGAKITEGVIVEKGGFSSCGSMKNWYTRVSVGTVLKLKSLPTDLVENLKINLKNWKFEIISEKKIDLEALKAEKARLETRLVEINSLLGE